MHHKSRHRHRRDRAALAGPRPRRSRAKARRWCWSGASEAALAEVGRRGSPRRRPGGHIAPPTSPPPTRPTASSRRALDAFGGIDVLVNAAGVIATGTLETTTDEAWDAMMGDEPARAVPLDARGGAAPEGAQRRDRQRVERQRPAIVCRRAGVLRQQGRRGSPDALRGARDGAARRARQRRESRRDRHQPAPPRRAWTRRSTRRFSIASKETHPLGRPGRARRSRVADPVSGVGHAPAG